MDDLVVREALTALPTMAQGLLRAFELMQQVKSFEDIERLFLKGAGLSINTYRSYLQSVKGFYAFTGGLNPLQVLPADIESYFDDLVSRGLDWKTILLRIAGLKKFFSGIRNVIPTYSSPFDAQIMSTKLREKLNARGKDGGTKKALSKAEIKRLLKHLQAEEDPVDYAMIFMILTSGLRAAEMLSIRYEDIDFSDDICTASFIAKGGKRVEHELYKPAVEAARASFRAMFQRDPAPQDHLYWITAQAEGEVDRRMTYHTLWHRVIAIGERVKVASLIRSSIEFTPHLFRRSYITQLYRSGMKLKALQSKSRHRSMEILVNHYVDDSEPAAPYLDKIYLQKAS